MSYTDSRLLLPLALLTALTAGAIALLRTGVYGWTLFLLVPVVIGGLAAFFGRAATGGAAAAYGALAVSAATFSLLGLGIEGFFCILMCLPLTVPLGALGGWFVFQIDKRKIETRKLTMFLLIPPFTIAWDVNAPPPVFAVHSAIEVAAAPEQVWKHVVSFSELPEPREWFFQGGLAYPKRARIVGSGPGAIRYCEFSTGAFVEPIEVWDEPRLLRFNVTGNPAPMHEWSPYGRVMPKHLHGYFISRRGQFQLTRLANGHTLLEGTTWYQHGLWPAQYWRLWSDAIIHRIHLRVLTHIRTLAEQEAAHAW